MSESAMPEFVKAFQFEDGKAPTINGVEIPWYIAAEGVHLDVGRGVSILWLPLLVESPLSITSDN